MKRISSELKGAKTIAISGHVRPDGDCVCSVMELYHYLKTREKAPLRKMQALIVISKKILTLIHTLARKKESYDPNKVFGHVRREQLKSVA